MKWQTLFCPKCEGKTPHAEESVVTLEYSIMWACLWCGHKLPPTDEDTDFGVPKGSPKPPSLVGA
jgi:hypothetical protein